MAINKEYNDIQLDVKFTQASTRANLVSEENISVSFGKISKYFADLHSQAFTGYSHPTHTAYSSGLYKITVDGLGHVSDTAAVTASDLPAHTHSDYVLKTGDTMSGNLTFAVADGSDTPGIVFKRGNFTDTSLDWKIYNSSGALMMDRTVAGDTETWQNKFKVDGTGIWYGGTQVSLVGHTHSQYLPKTTYEWNKEISFGNSGYLKIGSFPMYDTNITIDINATTSKTYHGTVVIATQNVSTTSMGSHKIHVYDDPTGNIATSLRIVWTSGSRNYDIYFVPQSWSKNFIHIRALGNYMDGATDICVSQTGTVPTTTLGLEPVNILSVTSTGDGNAVTKVEIDSIGNLAVTKGSTFLTEHPTIPKSADTTSTASPGHGGTFTVVDSVIREANGHVTKINTKTVTLPADSNTDTKVTQSSSTTSDFRPLLLGKNNQTNPENLETTVTDQTYVTKHVFVQPSTGNLTLYNASGDSPSLIFRRGTMIDNLNDWKIYVSGGGLYFAQSTSNASSETWTNRMYFHPSDGNLYVGSTKVSLSNHTHGNITSGGALQTTDITIASGDKLVVTDSSDSNKVARASISFDGSTTTKCLTQKGTWETFASSNTDIKVNVTLATTTKAYLLGTSTTPTATAQAVTSVADTGVYLGTTAGSLYAGDFKTTSTNHGVIFTDGTSSYGSIFDNGSNLWIGATGSTQYHHRGLTLISTGWSGTLPTSEGSLTGNPSIEISIPTYTVAAGATTGTWNHVRYSAIHSGNFTTAGSGNAITSVSFTNNKLTFTKGSTFLTSHQSVTDGNPTLSWGNQSTVATIGSTDIHVTMPANPNTDTKVTSTANHYTPETVSGKDKTASASGATAAWSIDVVKGVTLNTDGKGHVTGISVTSGKIPGNPNTDRYVNSAAFADDSTNTAASPVKMTLTRAGSDTATVTANIPKVSSSSAGVAPKGAKVSTQSQSTKFLREDGSWAAPSYTSIPSNNVTGSGTSGYLTKWNGTNTITNGPQLGSSTTTYLNNAGSWATPPDTKNTAGSTDTSSKIFLIGATSQAANPQTYSDNEVYTTSGVLTTKKVQVGGGHCTMEYNSTTETLDFVFA